MVLLTLWLFGSILLPVRCALLTNILRVHAVARESDDVLQITVKLTLEVHSIHLIYLDMALKKHIAYHLTLL